MSTLHVVYVVCGVIMASLLAVLGVLVGEIVRLRRERLRRERGEE